MFKLSVISDEVSQDLIKVVKFALSHKLDGIEIRSLWNLPPHKLVGKSGGIRKILSKYGLEVSAIASPFFKANIDSDREYKEHLMILKNCIDLAKSLDTNIIRGFTFWRKNSYDEYEETIMEKFGEPLDIIEEEGIILAIENEPSTFATNARLVTRFLNKIKSHYIKAVFDPGNDIGDPYGEIPYPEGYNIVKNHIIHIHVKDGYRDESGNVVWTPIGEGNVKYHDLIRALLRDQYKGYLSLETHWRPRISLSKELEKMPKGYKFSELGEEASTICIINLKKIIEEVM